MFADVNIQYRQLRQTVQRVASAAEFQRPNGASEIQNEIRSSREFSKERRRPDEAGRLQICGHRANHVHFADERIQLLRPTGCDQGQVPADAAAVQQPGHRFQPRQRRRVLRQLCGDRLCGIQNLRDGAGVSHRDYYDNAR